jgi:alkylated DNA repair dioxygenase AlkB
MEQLSFFAEAGQSKGLPKELLEYHANFVDQQTSDYLLQKFIKETPWKQSTQKMWDKEYLTPRLTSWHGDIGTDYSVSGKISNPNPWIPEQMQLKKMVETVAGIKFNSVLLNYYRDGNDFPLPGTATVKAYWVKTRSSPPSASARCAALISATSKNYSEHYSVKLEHGSFLLMKAGLQEHWEHRIAKSIKPMKARINLTFRVVI